MKSIEDHQIGQNSDYSYQFRIYAKDIDTKRLWWSELTSEGYLKDARENLNRFAEKIEKASDVAIARVNISGNYVKFEKIEEIIKGEGDVFKIENSAKN